MKSTRITNNVPGIVCSRDSSNSGVDGKNLALSSKVKDLWFRPGCYMAVDGIGMGNLIYERSRVDQAGESFKVIKQSARIIHSEMNSSDRSLLWIDVALSLNHVMWKDFRGIVAPIFTFVRGVGLRGDAIDQ